MGLAADTTVAGPVCSIARLQARIGSYFCADPNIGYDPEVALCDLMDNCVDAGASSPW